MRFLRTTIPILCKEHKGMVDLTCMHSSYDVFDTLIGRLCHTGVNIFSVLENISNLDNFKVNRITYESQTKDFDETYLLLENHYGKNLNYVKKLELELELEMSFPIKKYLKRIQTNDILISDMYLNESQIRKLLNKHVNVENKIFASYDGKRSNTIWKDTSLKKSIACHYGDNHISDYKNPVNNNIKAVHIDDTIMMEVEKLIYNVNSEIASIIRSVRLSHDAMDNMGKMFKNPVLLGF